MTPSALLVASALALLRPALGLDVARSARLSGNGRDAYEADGELIAGDEDADEQDDQLTEDGGLLGPGPYWSKKPEEFRAKAIWSRRCSGCPDAHADIPDASRYFTVSEEEISSREAAKKQCSQWNETEQPGVENGTITYLVTRWTDLGQLEASLPRLRYYFLKIWPYPVKVFVVSESLREYDNDTFNNLTCGKDTFDHVHNVWVSFENRTNKSCRGGSAPNREEVSKVLSESLGADYDWEVVPFDLRIPEVVKNDPRWEACQREHLKCGLRFQNMNRCAAAVSTGYKHMNQFFTKVMYENEALNRYRYYLRLDADFEFRGHISRDPFCLMAKTGRKFVWQTRRRNGNIECTEGIWDWFKKYQEDNGLTPQDSKFWRPEGALVNYVGYAGMGDLDFFRSERVRKLAEAFNKDGRVYLSRWSDQTYYVLLFALFENHSAVGDLGFTWPDGTWCHKCKAGDKLDPETGETTQTWHVLPKRRHKYPPGFQWNHSKKPGPTRHEPPKPSSEGVAQSAAEEKAAEAEDEKEKGKPLSRKERAVAERRARKAEGKAKALLRP